MKYKLSDVVDRINGNVDRFTTSLEYYVGGEHFESNELEITGCGLIKPNVNILGFKFHFAFQPGDVLYMARNPHLRKAGMVNFSGICSDASYILRTKDSNVLCQEYLAVIMQSNHLWDYCESHKVGSVNFAINWKTLANYEFDLPDINIQRSIANRIWAAYRVKQAYKKLISATDEMVKSQFIEWFGNAIQSVPLEDVVEILDNKRKPLNDSQRSGMKSGQLYPYYGATGVVDYVNAFLTDEDLICLAEDCGAYGPGEQSSYIIEGKAWVNNHAHVLRAKDNVILKYLQFFFTLTDLNEFISGTTRKKLTQSALKKIKVTLPDIELQELFVAIAEQADKSKYYEINET